MFYQEITIIPNDNVPVHQIMSHAFAQLHYAIATAKNEYGIEGCGLSFPHYTFAKGNKRGHLGNKIRIFAESREALEKMDVDSFLSRLHDFVHITSIHPVPSMVKGYSEYKRVRPIDGRIKCKARRYASRHGLSFEEARSRYEENFEECGLPFARFMSSSTKQNIFVFVKKIPLPANQQGDFSSYGLSKGGAVPEF